MYANVLTTNELNASSEVKILDGMRLYGPTGVHVMIGEQEHWKMDSIVFINSAGQLFTLDKKAYISNQPVNTSNCAKKISDIDIEWDI